jgi:hypothetical protein
MAVYEALLLNTVVPQIQAAQAGDSYVMVVNATTPALRITQTGTGNALEVEDSANPDATPFVVSAAGDVGIGTNAPAVKLHVSGAGSTEMRVTNSTASLNAVMAAGTSSMDFGTNTNHRIDFYTNSSLRATLDTSGNLGLGVTPSASAGAKAINIGSIGYVFGDGAVYKYNSGITNNAYVNGNGTFAAIQSRSAGVLEIDENVFKWRQASTGTANNTLSLTQAMTLDASGRLLVGTTSVISGYTLNVGGQGAFVGPSADSDGNSGVRIDYGNSSGTVLRFLALNANGSTNAAIGLNMVDSSNGSMVFSTRGSNSLAERARITSGGDLQIANGNLVMSTSGKGIDFSATSSGTGTMTSELLNDYEEGTWTPTVTPETSGTITIVSPNACAYTKIGRVVTVNGLIEAASVSSPVGSYVTVNNLPFTSNATQAQRSAGAVRCFSLTSGALNTNLIVTSSATSFVVYVDASLFQSGAQIYFQLSYTV